jgi:hypothetical protein
MKLSIVWDQGKKHRASDEGVSVTSTGIRKRTEWGRCIVLKGTSES